MSLVACSAVMIIRHCTLLCSSPQGVKVIGSCEFKEVLPPDSSHPLYRVIGVVSKPGTREATRRMSFDCHVLIGADGTNSRVSESVLYLSSCPPGLPPAEWVGANRHRVCQYHSFTSVCLLSGRILAKNLFWGSGQASWRYRPLHLHPIILAGEQVWLSRFLSSKSIQLNCTTYLGNWRDS